MTRFCIRHWLANGAAMFTLAACSSASLTPQNPPLAQPVTLSHTSGIAGALKTSGGFLKRTGAQNFLFVGDDGTSSVWLLDPTQSGMPPIGQITDGVNGPAGLGADSEGTLYVTNQASSPPSVAVYPAGHLHPSLQLTNGIKLPWAVAADSQRTVYVSNPFASPANVVAYKAGQSTPFETIIGFSAPIGLTVDKLNNLYVADLRNGVYVVPFGSETPTNLNLQDLVNATSIAVDARGVLSVSSIGGPSNPAEILRYGKGKTIPTMIITNNVYSPQYVTYARALHTLYVTMQGGSPGSSYVAGFKAGQRKAWVFGFNPLAAVGLGFSTNSKW